ncbi:GGDEF domain-containing protein [Corticibacterium sp. UT-5YL-CI-8]|nr:GGDEF domain-containing protein [Tianweitania sp. UT-5YL-CI-8]
MLGFWLNYMGVRLFHGNRPSPTWIAAFLAISTIAMLATFHIWYARNPVYTLAQSVPLLVTLLYLLPRVGRDLGAAITCAALAVASIAHLSIAGGNILIVAGIAPDLNLRDAAALDLLAFLFAAATWNFGFLISVIGYLRREVERLANEDDLTGLANRRLFMNHLNAACARTSQQSFSVMLFDLDRFKDINDIHGHAAGDAALKHAADVLRNQFRPTDVFARLGGDEFCALLPDISEAEASAFAARALGSLHASPFVWRDLSLDISASVGVASSETSEALNPSSLMEEADRALYETKRRGRNGFTVHARALEPHIPKNVINFEPKSVRPSR